MERGLAIIGDIHGRLHCIHEHSRQFENIDYIQAGDFGAGLMSAESKQMRKLDTRLGQRGHKLYIVRGNHDNPFYFQDPTWRNDDLPWTSEMKNIEYVEDYTVLNLAGHNILCVGGAISIDRRSRIVGRDVWPGAEIFKLNAAKLKSFRDINIVVTHNAPTFADPIGFNETVMHFAKYDLDLLSELTKERSDLAIMYDILIENNYIDKWYYGHFHFDNIKPHDATTFILLGIDTIREIAPANT